MFYDIERDCVEIVEILRMTLEVNGFGHKFTDKGRSVFFQIVRVSSVGVRVNDMLPVVHKIVVRVATGTLK
jgi:hypothetical protein